MTAAGKAGMSEAITRKALEFGASLAGIANIKDLKGAPSFTLAPRLPKGESVGNRESDLKPGEVAWPKDGMSALVIAYEHPEDKPELDWWQNRKATAGNNILIKILNRVGEWVEGEYGIKPYHIVYHIEKGGIFLKDSAVFAGLGVIGKNNLLITPQFGPRVRLRSMIFTEDLPSMGPIDYDPCKGCDMPCRRACPNHSLGTKVYSAKEMKQTILPGGDGWYSRDTCNLQMEKDLENAEEVRAEGQAEPDIYVKYCRACETACYVGKK
jgi:epoxyqueuosine reductase